MSKEWRAPKFLRSWRARCSREVIYRVFHVELVRSKYSKYIYRVYSAYASFVHAIFTNALVQKIMKIHFVIKSLEKFGTRVSFRRVLRTHNFLDYNDKIIYSEAIL